MKNILKLLLVISFLPLLMVNCTEKMQDIAGIPTEPTMDKSSWGVKNDITPPLKPIMDKKITGKMSGQITLVISPGIGTSDSVLDFNGYNIYRSNVGAPNWSAPVNSTLISKKDLYYDTGYIFIDKTVVNSTSYYYKIEALDLAGNKTNLIFGPITPAVWSANTGTISGTVTDNKGNPIKNALVIAYKRTNPLSFDDNTYTFTTDASGYYHIRVEPEEYAIFAVTKDATSKVTQIDIAVGMNITGINIIIN